MTKVHLPTGRSYDVFIQRGLAASCGRLISEVHRPCRVAVVSDDNVFPLHGRTVCESLSGAGFETVTYVIPHGEQSKSLASYGELLGFLAKSRISRGDILLALGGGVVGDLTGFAAATYLRGIPYVQIPTTLLACVDSSVGGKTAVDLEAGKNLVGAFWQPICVICDPDLLSTLPSEIFRDGCAEVIKYGVLGDRAFFDRLAAVHASEIPEEVIARSVEMKRDIVAEDEFDRGCRQLLNLGHTFGHAVEARSGYRLSHGQCVSIGMCMAARAAAREGICPEQTVSEIERLLALYGLPTACPNTADELLEVMLSDKKAEGSRINLILPREIGNCVIHTVPTAELGRWLEEGVV